MPALGVCGVAAVKVCQQKSQIVISMNICYADILKFLFREFWWVLRRDSDRRLGAAELSGVVWVLVFPVCRGMEM